MFKEALRSIYRQSKDSYHARMAFHRWCKMAEATEFPELMTMEVISKVSKNVRKFLLRSVNGAFSGGTLRVATLKLPFSAHQQSFFSQILPDF